MIEKEGNKTVVTGLVEDQVIDTHGGDFTYDLQIDYDSIDSIFRSYKREKIRVTIEVIEDEEVNEEEADDQEVDTW